MRQYLYPAFWLAVSLAAAPACAQILGNGPLPTGGFHANPAPQVPLETAPRTPKPEASTIVRQAPASKAPARKASAPKAQAKATAPLVTGSIATSGLDGSATPTPKPKPKSTPVAVPKERVVDKDDRRPSVHPDSLRMISEAAARYRLAAEGGGWLVLPPGIMLKSGSEGPLVLQLRQRLIAEGDLAQEESENPRFDSGLASAVKRFQSRMGYRQDGIVGGTTLKALRISAEERARQLEESARRLSAKANFNFGARYVVVNIPSASVEAIANGDVERRYIAVVGKPERASPEVATRITNVNFNPTWTVPVSIIKKDIIPKMQKDPAYLSKQKIRIFGASGAEIDPAKIDWHTERATAFTLRQDAGAGNSLGQIRIDMPNREAVYMHDTPSKRLFQRDDRFHSSGCVRVENVRGFVEWLLKPVPRQNGGEWDQAAIGEAIEAGQRKDVRLKDYVPVIWTYLTGFVTPDGQVHFREDVYGHDDGQSQRDALDAVAREAITQDLPAGHPGLTPPRTSIQSQQAPRAPRTNAEMRDNAQMVPVGNQRGSRVLYGEPPVQRIDP